MKVFLICAITLSFLGLLLPAVICPGSAKKAEQTAVPAEDAQSEIRQESTKAEELPQPTETVTVKNGDVTMAMDLEEYLVGVVAGEMPADFEPEALKAQAVASRTYTLYKKYVQPSKTHAETVCTDPFCCKAYSDIYALQLRWGEDYEQNMAKIRDAVRQTQGEYLVYGGEPILAVFHSSSSGATENSASVWLSQLPYLVSVSSPETEADVRDFVSTVTVSSEEFARTVLSEYPAANLSGDVSDWVGESTKNASGRVETICLGGVDVPGKTVRQMFSLRSADFSLEGEDNSLTFTVRGYGHGVGMSQYGANVMAKNGSSYDEILRWYYTGAQIRSLDRR